MFLQSRQEGLPGFRQCRSRAHFDAFALSSYWLKYVPVDWNEYGGRLGMGFVYLERTGICLLIDSSSEIRVSVLTTPGIF